MHFFKKRISVKAKIISGLLLASIMIVVVGVIAHNSLSDLVHTISQEAKPDMKLITLKSMLSDLSGAENNFRTFTITEDSTDLNNYYESVTSIEQDLNRLSRLVHDKQQKEKVDSMQQLVQEKWDLLNDFLALRKEDRVNEALQKISQNLSEAQEESEDKRGGLFNRRRKDDEPVLENMQEVVAQVKKQEQQKQEEASQKELALLIQDEVIMDKVTLIINEMETEAVAQSKLRAENASRNANKTSTIITLFLVIAFVLLLLLGYVVFSYISRTKRYNRAMKAAKNKAEKLAKVKEEFLANMSHEMRTPMNAIVGFSEQLGKTDLNNPQRKYLDTIRNSSEHLLVVINDILDHAKLESGKMNFKKAGFKIKDLINVIYETLLPEAQNKGIELKYEIDENIPEVLIGDEARLKQILINLASNAIKFTEEGSVSINCKAVLKAEDSMKLKVEVIDTGIGISEESQKRIFDDFYQSDVGSTRKYGGTGLGLTITRKLVELQEGTIDVNSVPGEGSQFTFVIPYDIGTEADLQTEEDTTDLDKDAFKNIAVLIADDEEYNRLLLNTILKKANMSITLCENGKEAIEELKNNDYDVILMDVRMPVMSGIDATKYIRHKMEGNKSKTPIIALTAAAQADDVKKCLGAGMNDFLPKPFKEVQLYQKISTVLGMENEPAKEDEPAKVETKSNNGVSMQQAKVKYNLDELIKLGNGDDAFVTEMIEVFIKNTRSGLEKMQKAFREDDIERVGHYAHKIVAPCRHLGIDDMVKDLKSIEEKALNQKTDLDSLHPLIDKVNQNAEVLLKALSEDLNRLKSKETSQA